MAKSKNIVKIIIITLVVFSICVLGVFFLNYLISDNNVIKGYYKAEEYFDPFSTQDSVDYCKYYYTSEYDAIFSNRYSKISKENITEIKEYFNKFKEWMDACDRLNEYDFDENIIDNNDFCLLYDKSNHNNSIEYKKFEYFTIHFYDTNSHILYYIHANI